MEASRSERKQSLKQKAKKEVEMEEEEEVEDVVELGFVEDEKKKRAVTVVASSGKKGSAGAGTSPPRCQVEKCTVDLNGAKRYHRRHKVCEHHSKAAVVLVAGLRQRFCQQCSRFHELSEFDEAKRSCRRRLAGHNERRRKNPSESQEGSIRRGASSPQLKENHCRQADEITLPGNATCKHFQIR